MNARPLIFTVLALSVALAGIAPSATGQLGQANALLGTAVETLQIQGADVPDSCAALQTLKGCLKAAPFAAPLPAPVPAGDGFVARIDVVGAIEVGNVLQVTAGDLVVSVDAFLADGTGVFRPYTRWTSLYIARDCGGLEAVFDPTPVGDVTQCQGSGEYVGAGTSGIPGGFPDANGHIDFVVPAALLQEAFTTDAPATIVRIRVVGEAFKYGVSDVNLAKDGLLAAADPHVLANQRALAFADQLENATPFTPTVLIQAGEEASSVGADGFTAAIEVAGGVRKGDVVAVQTVDGGDLVVKATIFVDENGWKQEDEGLYGLRLFGFDAMGNSVTYPDTPNSMHPDSCDIYASGAPATGPHPGYHDCHPGANGKYTWTIPYDALPASGSGFQVQVQKMSESYGNNIGQSNLFTPRDALLIAGGVRAAPAADAMDAAFTPLLVLPAGAGLAADGYTAQIDVVGSSQTRGNGLAVAPNEDGDIVIRAKPFILRDDGTYGAPTAENLFSLGLFTVDEAGAIERFPTEGRLLCSVGANGWCVFPAIAASDLAAAGFGTGAGNGFHVDVSRISDDGERGIADSYLFLPKDQLLANGGVRAAPVADLMDSTLALEGQTLGAFTPVFVVSA